MDSPLASVDLFGIQVTSHLNTKRVSFNIVPVNEHTRYLVVLVENALVAEKLNVPPTSVNKVILGSDVTKIIIPREVREGPKGSQFGIKAKLGWTVTELSQDILEIHNLHVSFTWLRLKKN